MTNYLLKFQHQNGTNVWFTVYCDVSDILIICEEIEKRTSYKYLYDYTCLGG